MKIYGFIFATGLLFLGFLGLCQGADRYPSRPIELVIPFAPGGNPDLGTRAYVDELAKVLKVPVTAVNRAGATGVLGTKYVVGKKDGYTLLATSDTPLVIMPVISKEVTYDPLRDFIPLGHFGYVASVFAVRSDSPFKTLSDLVEYAKKNPGKLKNAAGGVGTESYFNLQLLLHREKIKITTVPFESGGEALPPLLGGHVDMSSNTIASLGPHLKAGTLRALAITSRKRNPEFPNIPTTAEVGCPEASLVVWQALFAPAGVPKEVVDVMVPAVENTFKNPDVVARATKTNITVDYMGPAEIRKLIESGLKTVRTLARETEMVK